MSLNMNRSRVRFTLKKRSIRKERDDVNISSYNSDFLSGLFADVAKISVLSDSEGCPKRGSEHMSDDPADESAHIVTDSPNKKRCTSLGRCLSRSRCSITNLADLSVQSPKAINELYRSGNETPNETSLPRPLHLETNDFTGSMNGNSMSGAKKCFSNCTHHDSLAFQLNCVSGSDSQSASADAAAIIAFPNLPATVSDSSCSAGLTRANLIRQASSPEKPSKESFGWFVDLDDQQTIDTGTRLQYSVSCDDLAFQAPTAPKGDSNEAEVQWAKAADTVDDVLGDFF